MPRDESGRLSAGKLLVTALALALTAAAHAATPESEPNGSTGAADSIAPGQMGTGSIDPIGDHDYWKAAGAAQFDLVFAYINTQDSSTSQDSVLDVLANNSLLIESDNDDGPGFSSVVAGAVVPQNGNVFFHVSRFNNSQTITPYELYQAIVPPDDVMQEQEDNDSPQTANWVTARIIAGNVGAGDTDFFSFTLFGGNKLVVLMDDDPDNNGAHTDTRISIISKNEVTVLATGDDDPTHNGNAAGPVTAAASGTYYVRVTNGGSVATNYRFVLLTNEGSRFTNACCLPDGTCQDLLGGSGGTSQGPGSLCATTPSCPPPAVGACCLPDCTCQEVSAPDCSALGGRFGGFSTTCATHNCGLTVYNSQADLLAAVPGLPIEDFEEGAVSPGDQTACGPVIDTTANACFSAGQIVPGLRIEKGGMSDMELFGDGGSYYGISVDQYSWVSKTVRTEKTVNVVFPDNNVFAVGLRHMALTPSTMSIIVQDLNHTNLTSVTRFTGPKGAFFGVSANLPISRLVLTHIQLAGVDDIVFGGLPDADGDGFFDSLSCRGPCTGGVIADCSDNCPTVSNPDQADVDSNASGDACAAPPAPCGVCAPSILPLALLPLFLLARKRHQRRS